jgi:tetrahydromethanopterin S-methyltransferase subunit G
MSELSPGPGQEIRPTTKITETPKTPESDYENSEKKELEPNTTEQQTNLQAEKLPSIEEARSLINNQSVEKPAVAVEQAPAAEATSPGFVPKSLKDMAEKRTLKQVRKNLPRSQRAFSHLVNQPVVDSVSEFSGKTIGRPSGLLAGSILAFIGSSIFLYIDKHYGYNYNFLLWALFFVGGFVIGLIFEVLVTLFRHSRSQKKFDGNN